MSPHEDFDEAEYDRQAKREQQNYETNRQHQRELEIVGWVFFGIIILLGVMT